MPRRAGKRELTEAEENELLSLVVSGRGAKPNSEAALAAERAKAVLLEHYGKFVIAICREYRGLGMSDADLQEAGFFGLSQGIDAYNPRRKAKLSTFAYFTIRSAIRKALSESSLLRISEKRISEARKVRQAKEDLSHALGRSPTVEEIALALATEPRRVKQALEVPIGVLSLDDDAPDFDGCAEEPAGPEPQAEENATSNEIGEKTRALLEFLTKQEKEIFLCRRGDGKPPMTYKEIGSQYGFTAERARQLYIRAEIKMEELAMEEFRQ